MAHKKIKYQKRQSQRVYYLTPVIIEQNNVWHGSIKDISQNGAFITSNQFPKMETILTLTFDLLELKDQKMKAQVIWMNSIGFGVQFLEPSVHQIHAINEIVIPTVEI